MTHSPDRKQRSAWESFDGPPLPEPDGRWWRRNVHDGELKAAVGTIPGEGLHLSISHRFARKVKHGDPTGRYPSWDEIMHARQTLLPSDVAFMMVLPAEAEYVAFHQTTFHLHEVPPEHTVRMGGKLWDVAVFADPDGTPKKYENGIVACLTLRGEPGE